MRFRSRRRMIALGPDDTYAHASSRSDAAAGSGGKAARTTAPGGAPILSLPTLSATGGHAMHPAAPAHHVRMFKTLFIAALLLLSLLSATGRATAQMLETGGSGATGPATGTDAATVALTYRLFNELLSAGNSTANADLIAADATLLTPEGAYAGPAGVDTYLAALRAPFADLRFAVTGMQTYGNETYGMVTTVQWTLTGHVGVVSPAVIIEGMSVITTGDGKIAHLAFHYDRAELASQIQVARYTEMEFARSGAPGQSVQVASGDDIYAPPVAGVQQAPVVAPTAEETVPVSRGTPR
jgi:hypothetical protein